MEKCKMDINFPHENFIIIEFIYLMNMNQG